MTQIDQITTATFLRTMAGCDIEQHHPKEPPMFHLTASTSNYIASRARFANFSDAANCAVTHVRQRGGDVQVRYAGNGTLVADLRMINGAVSVAGVCEGKRMVEEWAR